jgi:hypothetical protein
MIAGPDGSEGTERVVADLHGRNALGSNELTNAEYDCLSIVLHLFMRRPAEQFEPWDLDAAERCCLGLARAFLHESGLDIVTGALNAANAAFLDYIRDLVALATVGVFSRALADAVGEVI